MSMCATREVIILGVIVRDRRQTALFFAVDNDSEEATAILLKAGAKTDLDYVKVFQ